MVKVLLVDDEAYVRDSVARLVNWAACGTQLIGSCKDYFDAMDAITDDMPDIIVTDVKMPVLSGLDLIEKTNELGYNIEYIVLSGYSEFEMAKTAMRFGVRHYILKPFGEGLIEKALEECIQQIALRRQQKRAAELGGHMREAYLRQMVPLMVRKRLSGLEADPMSSWPETSPIQVDIYGYPSAELADIAMRAEESNIGSLLMAPFRIGQTVILICTADTGGVPAGYGCKWETELADISRALEELAGEYDMVVVYQDGQERVETLPVHALDQIDRLAKKLDTLFTQHDKDSITKAMEQTLDGIAPEVLQAAYAKALMRYVYLGVLSGEDAAKVLKALYLVQGSQVMEEAERQSVLLVQGAPGGRNVIERVCHYVDEHYADENLSLHYIAQEYAYMNQDYLGKLFCKAMGKRFSAYLVEKRIEIAKQLLGRYDGEKVYSIAEKVGFGSNVRYFSQLFKKHTGTTPGEYAEKSKTENRHL